MRVSVHVLIDRYIDMDIEMGNFLIASVFFVMLELGSALKEEDFVLVVVFP